MKASEIVIEHSDCNSGIAYDAPIVRFWITLDSGVRLYFSDMNVSEWDTDAETEALIEERKKSIASLLDDLAASIAKEQEGR